MSTGVYMAEKTIEFVNYLGQRVEFDPSELNEITARLKDKTDLTKDYLEECNSYTKELLAKYNKEYVIRVIKDFHENQVDYKKLYDDESDNDKKKEILKFMQISNVLTLQLSIQKQQLNIG